MSIFQKRSREKSYFFMFVFFSCSFFSFIVCKSRSNFRWKENLYDYSNFLENFLNRKNYWIELNHLRLGNINIRTNKSGLKICVVIVNGAWFYTTMNCKIAVCSLSLKTNSLKRARDKGDFTILAISLTHLEIKILLNL